MNNIKRILMTLALAAPLALAGCGDDDDNGGNGGNGNGGNGGIDAGTDASTPLPDGSVAEMGFRDDPATAYTRVDRMGMPAVSTALISGADATDPVTKEEYNDDSPTEDAAAEHSAELLANLQAIITTLGDQLELAGYDVCADAATCAFQTIAPGVPVVGLIVPDTLTLGVMAPPSFPNGRRLSDPVIDITLAVALLDLNDADNDYDGQPMTPGTFAAIPLNPAANDVDFMEGFPFLAEPHPVAAP